MKLIYDRDDHIERVDDCPGFGMSFRFLPRGEFRRVLSSFDPDQIINGEVRSYVHDIGETIVVAADLKDHIVTLFEMGRYHAMAVIWHSGYVSTSDGSYFELELVLGRRFERDITSGQARHCTSNISLLVRKIFSVFTRKHLLGIGPQREDGANG
jgi:hypothetical protein